mmetsp:Transcript_22083/g.33370  ORF Transcript_22083/g.33370 Transcript_22083/m.33370 type:complete len:316 (+) Transcript_22083:156-1103(+)
MIKAYQYLSHKVGFRIFQTRLFSPNVNHVADPGKFIEGITSEDVEKNPELADFIRANFSERASTVETIETGEREVSLDEKEDDGANHLNIRKMYCYLRDPIEEEGSRRCETLRETRREIPGLLYGGDPTLDIISQDPGSRIFVKTPWSVLQRETDLYRRSFESRVYDLTVYEDETEQACTVHRVIPSDMQWHPIKNKLYCANYLRYHAGRPIKIPIKYVNEEDSPVMKRGAFIAPINRYVSCLVEDGVPIPDFIEVDCTGLDLKNVVRMDRVIIPEGVRVSKYVKQDRFIVGTVFGARGAKGESTTADEGNETDE